LLVQYFVKRLFTLCIGGAFTDGVCGGVCFHYTKDKDFLFRLEPLGKMTIVSVVMMGVKALAKMRNSIDCFSHRKANQKRLDHRVCLRSVHASM
jgi:hypothetical protein